MANVNDNYYMLNGTEYGSETIYVPFKDGFVKNTSDISDLDLATIDLGTSLRDALVEANPTIKLREQYFIGKFPYERGIKIFKPIEMFKETERTVHVINGFRELAEERNYKYYKGSSLELDSKIKALELVYYMLKSLNDSDYRDMFSYESILGRKIKEDYKHNKFMFEREIVNYTQLRNMVLYYLAYKADRRVVTRDQIKLMEESLKRIKGLYPEDPDKIKSALEDYKKLLLQVKNEEERRQAEEELKRKTVVPQYTQLTFEDVYPELAGQVFNPPKRLGRTKDLLDE